MSFGKDNDNLQAIQAYGGGSMRQRAANATRRGGGGRRGGRAYWADTFRPAVKPGVSLIRVLPSQIKTQRLTEENQLYEEVTEWKEVTEHYHAGLKRGALCSAGPFRMIREQRQPCHGCDLFWSKPKGERFISMSPRYIMNVLDYGYFHKVPQIDRKTNQYRMNPKTNQPYTEWVKHADQGCMHCTTATETKQGYVYPWMMSGEMFQTLNGYADTVASSCRSCGGPPNSVYATSWHCSGCGVCVFDLLNTTVPTEQIEATVTRPYSCQSCGTFSYLNEVYACRSCQNPSRATIFDVDIQVQTVQTSEKKWSLLIPWHSSPQGIHENFTELVTKYVPDLDKRFAPTALDKQAQVWNLAGPQQQPQPQQYQQPQYQQYGQQPPPAPTGAIPGPFPGVGDFQQQQQPVNTAPPQQPAVAAQPIPTSIPGGYTPPGGTQQQ